VEASVARGRLRLDDNRGRDRSRASISNSNFRVATGLAVLVVAIELLVISWIRNRCMDTPFLRAAFQVIVGILIGSS
jgi:hypothetical protein